VGVTCAKSKAVTDLNPVAAFCDFGAVLGPLLAGIYFKTIGKFRPMQLP
jgi:hypothetical protein